MKKLLILIPSFLLLCAVIPAQKNINRDPETSGIVTSDIENFWKAYDKAKPENDLIVFRDEYIRKGSDGLKDFVPYRIISSCNMVEVIAAAPKYFAALRKPSLKVASYENQMRKSFRRLKEIYPDAIFPNVYFVIGGLNSAGTSTDSGLIIGVDMFGRNEGSPLDELDKSQLANISPVEKLPYVVAHELIHFQQKSPAGKSTLLSRALHEGAADFIGELISGKNSNPNLHEYGDPIEKKLWLEFKKDMSDTDSKDWLYTDKTRDGRPADLGYYIGYKIAESYYKNAADKKQAVKDIIEIKDPDKFLADSRYDQKPAG